VRAGGDSCRSVTFDQPGQPVRCQGARNQDVKGSGDTVCGGGGEGWRGLMQVRQL